MKDVDDFLTGDVPDPDAEPTTAERAHAKAFAELVDKAISSPSNLPPAMSADDRALLEMATVIRAASGGMPLAQSKQKSVVEDALRQAIGGTASTSLSTTPVVDELRKRRWLPWTIAGAASVVAAAAIVMLVIRKPTVINAAAVATEVPMHWKSRPADPLIGRISNECGKQSALDCAKEATVKTSSRIDHIFADRLDGYRDRRFSRSKRSKP